MENRYIRNEILVRDIRNFMEKNKLIADTRIYFNSVAYAYDYKVSREKYTLIENVQPSRYFEYADDSSVNMTFEGVFYNIMNYGENGSLQEEFDSIFERHNCYYELGNAWNLIVRHD